MPISPRSRLKSLLLIVLALAATAALFFFSLGGCIADGTRHAQVFVTDAETGQPISNARFEVHYPHGPGSRYGTTDPRGVGGLEAYPAEPQRWSASAKGYLPAHEDLPASNNTQAQLRFSLHRQSTPQVSLVLPDGYRGPLRITFVPNSIPVEATRTGQMTSTVSPTGRASIPVAPLLAYDISAPSGHIAFQLRYADGTQILESTAKTGPQEIAIWFVASSDQQSLFIIGTMQEAAAMRAAVWSQLEGFPTFKAPAFHAIFNSPATRPLPQPALR